MDHNPSHDGTMAKLEMLFGEVCNDPELTISASTTADDIAGWDALRHIALLVAAERDSDIHFKASEMDGLHAVGALVQLIDAKRMLAAAAP